MTPRERQRERDKEEEERKKQDDLTYIDDVESGIGLTKEEEQMIINKLREPKNSTEKKSAPKKQR